MGTDAEKSSTLIRCHFDIALLASSCSHADLREVGLQNDVLARLGATSIRNRNTCAETAPQAGKEPLTL